MKHLRLAWLPMLLIGLSSCFCTTIPAFPADAFEPNDSSAQASLITDALEATMNEGETPDVFAFDATAGQRVGLALTQLGGSFLVLTAEIRAPDGTLVGNVTRLGDYGSGARAETPLEFIAPTSGRYVLTLTGRYNGPPDSFCSVGRLRYRLQLQHPSAPSTPVTALPADLVGVWKRTGTADEISYRLGADGSFVEQSKPIGCGASFVVRSEFRGTVALDASSLKFSRTIGWLEETYCPNATKRLVPIDLSVSDLAWSLNPAKTILTLDSANFERQP